MPEELGDIFLFSGENLSSAMSNEDDEKIRESILKVTGISNANTTLNYLEDFTKSKEAQKDALEKKSIKSDKLRKELGEAENLRDKYSGRIKESARNTFQSTGKY